MNIEARLQGGPADTRIVAIPRLMPVIKVAHMPRIDWMAIETDPMHPLHETHFYEPVRAIVFYEHTGQQ